MNAIFVVPDSVGFLDGGDSFALDATLFHEYTFVFGFELDILEVYLDEVYSDVLDGIATSILSRQLSVENFSRGTPVEQVFSESIIWFGNHTNGLDINSTYTMDFIKFELFGNRKLQSTPPISYQISLILIHRDGFPRLSARSAWRGDAGHPEPRATPPAPWPKALGKPPFRSRGQTGSGQTGSGRTGSGRTGSGRTGAGGPAVGGPAVGGPAVGGPARASGSLADDPHRLRLPSYPPHGPPHGPTHRPRDLYGSLSTKPRISPRFLYPEHLHRGPRRLRLHGVAAKRGVF